MSSDFVSSRHSKEYKCPKSLKTLLERCWDKDPSKRPTCVEIVDKLERKCLLHCAIHNPSLQTIWVEHVCKGSAEGTLVREVGAAA